MADRACVVIVEHNQLLMVRQTYQGRTFWTFPGGSIEPEETPEAAAIRETKEETCLEIDIVRLLYETARETSTGTYYCFLGRIIGGVAALGQDPELPIDSQELSDLRWFPLHAVRNHLEVARIWEELVLFLPALDSVERCAHPYYPRDDAPHGCF
ncbi:MAG TPA: NUDIX domain-containing protein [Herpetosiphonaceae bacterium]|nr:NUDIX domain-containing protein [Herpetosiphonaceae bacterium]